MYHRSAAIYDAIYHAMGKDYAAEAGKLDALIQQHKHSTGNALLDVACGTGGHIGYLRGTYLVEGLDISEEMLAEAKKRYPDVRFHQADMADFRIGRSFDVITCLFSAIGFVETQTRLFRAISAFAAHLQPGGVAVVEPWFGPGVLDTSGIHAVFVDEPKLKIARMNVNRIEGTLSYLDFEYLVGSPDGITNFRETLRLGLFTDDEYQEAFREAGLLVVHDQSGLDGRGLYIGIREPGRNAGRASLEPKEILGRP